MAVLILLTVIIPFLILNEVTNNFQSMRGKYGLIMGLLFITGVYFYATGNGVHELASFFFNTYCGTKNVSEEVCEGMFFNDYYFGNILYFIGAFLMNAVLILFERKNLTPFPFTLFLAISYSIGVFASLLVRFF